MISIWGWIADAILALLLVCTLVMAIRLDRALRVVRRDRAVFEALISNLGSATNSVKLGIKALRNEADRAAEQIERRSDDADKLATDLSFLIEAADRAGARLDEARQSSPAPDQPRECDTSSAPAATGSTVVDPPIADPPGDLSRSASGGVRQFAGIARRRRTSAPGTSGSLKQGDVDPPLLDETVLPSKSQVTHARNAFAK
jgi:hypothetical protein